MKNAYQVGLAFVSLFICAGAFAQTSLPKFCRSPKAVQCDFYRSCVEETYGCGAQGYPLGYGEKYCHRFSALNENDLSAAGLKWRDRTLICLQQAISPLLYSSHEFNTCPTLKTFAFRSHVACYTSPGSSICDLSVGDWTEIGTTVDFGDAMSTEGRQQVVAVIKTCRDQLMKEHKRLTVQSARFSRTTKSLDETRRKVDELEEKIRFIDELE